ncbi:unnamed protein product [Arabis nemorensis]|uniref:Uncharacterized protein n=1 Tax=Arabis nemorensis TaxID=586526 RepID=A0A565BV70_9BRAS|nr:unnamed protein product [Arabis nemorensis]
METLLLAPQVAGTSMSLAVSLGQHLQMEDFVFKVSLGFILIARPEYMLEEANVGMKIQALQNMYEYLLDVEKQLG